MRYHNEPPEIKTSMFGRVYECDHPLYDRATLYLINDVGLCVIQQRFNEISKTTWWSEIDPWLTDQIYTAEGFLEFFKEYAKASTDGLYPTVTVRQIMWALRMKPIPREPWETAFDHKPV